MKKEKKGEKACISSIQQGPSFNEAFLMNLNQSKPSHVAVKTLFIDDYFHLVPLTHLKLPSSLAHKNPFFRRLSLSDPNLFSDLSNHGFSFETLDILACMYRCRLLVLNQNTNSTNFCLRCTHHYTYIPDQILDRFKPFQWDNQLSEYEQYYLLQHRQNLEDKFVIKNESHCYFLLPSSYSTRDLDSVD